MQVISVVMGTKLCRNSASSRVMCWYCAIVSFGICPAKMKTSALICLTEMYCSVKVTYEVYKDALEVTVS